MSKKYFSFIFSVAVIDSWYFMRSPTALVLTFAIYFLFVLKIGPRYMKDRKPMKLNTFIRGYNIFQVIACVFFVEWGIYRGVNPITFHGTLQCTANRISLAEHFDLCDKTWWFMMLRLVELVETVIFVLRKKQNQVSALHLYHHTSTVWLLWIILKYSPSKLCGEFWVCQGQNGQGTFTTKPVAGNFHSLAVLPSPHVTRNLNP